MGKPPPPFQAMPERKRTFDIKVFPKLIQILLFALLQDKTLAVKIAAVSIQPCSKSSALLTQLGDILFKNTAHAFHIYIFVLLVGAKHQHFKTKTKQLGAKALAKLRCALNINCCAIENKTYEREPVTLVLHCESQTG